MIGRNCKTCDHWREDAPVLAAHSMDEARGGFGLGTCQRLPPVVFAPTDDPDGFYPGPSVWPQTNGDRTCGEWAGLDRRIGP